MITITEYTISCSECGISFSVPEWWAKARREDHKTFNCPNGHHQYFAAKTEAEKLKVELDRSIERERIARAETQGEQRKRVRAENRLKRVKCGVCPDCNRSFTNLRRHMATKHGTKE